jgi:hypothetical protein
MADRARSKKWANYYRPESQAGREAFFDHFLLGRATSLAAWPRVRIEVRDRHDIAEWRDEAEWPLARIEPTPLWLGADGGLHLAAPHAAGKTAYDAQTGSAVFEHRFAQDTEITGHASLRLWVEAEGADDMDLFVALQSMTPPARLWGRPSTPFSKTGRLPWAGCAPAIAPPIHSAAPRYSRFIRIRPSSACAPVKSCRSISRSGRRPPACRRGKPAPGDPGA